MSPAQARIIDRSVAANRIRRASAGRRGRVAVDTPGPAATAPQVEYFHSWPGSPARRSRRRRVVNVDEVARLLAVAEVVIDLPRSMLAKEIPSTRTPLVRVAQRLARPVGDQQVALGSARWLLGRLKVGVK